MRVKDWITNEVITIKPTASVKEAFGMLKSLGIRHLPVVQDGLLKGIVTDRDLRRPKLSDVFRSWDELYRINDEIQVEDVMANPAITISPEEDIREAAKRMVQNRIGALPVTDLKGKLVGIITQTDILRAYASGKANGSGVKKPKSRLASRKIKKKR